MKPSASLLLATAAVASLTACSGPYTISAEVTSFGALPEGSKPTSYVFERLPSQQHSPELLKRQAELEESARNALAKAGLQPAAEGKAADLLVTLGARINATAYAPWEDPLWTRWRFGLFGGNGFYSYGRYGAYGGYSGFGSAGYWHGRFDARYDRQVAVLIRDRHSTEAIYEAHAANDGGSRGDNGLFAALFEAAMSDFPKANPEGHRVSVQAIR